MKKNQFIIQVCHIHNKIMEQHETTFIDLKTHL